MFNSRLVVYFLGDKSLSVLNYIWANTVGGGSNMVPVEKTSNIGSLDSSLGVIQVNFFLI